MQDEIKSRAQRRGNENPFEEEPVGDSFLWGRPSGPRSRRRAGYASLRCHFNDKFGFSLVNWKRVVTLQHFNRPLQIDCTVFVDPPSLKEVCASTRPSSTVHSTTLASPYNQFLQLVCTEIWAEEHWGGRRAFPRDGLDWTVMAGDIPWSKTSIDWPAKLVIFHWLSCQNGPSKSYYGCLQCSPLSESWGQKTVHQVFYNDHFLK